MVEALLAAGAAADEADRRQWADSALWLHALPARGMPAAASRLHSRDARYVPHIIAVEDARPTGKTQGCRGQRKVNGVEKEGTPPSQRGD